MVVEQRVKENAKGVDVGRRGYGLSRELLWCGITRRTKDMIPAVGKRQVAIVRIVCEF